VCSAGKNRTGETPHHAPPATQRRHKRAHALLLIAIALLACAARAQSASKPARAGSTPTPRSGVAFDGERALTHVRKLVEFGPRPAGSDALKRARAYLVSVL
jgi:hypothetical protein